ncbi:rab-GTPase-TBC domain-containing protein [Ditylenchus destructor]|nr:rab-GTPase-TBC domain-containing protein [Ditylenchus destructor]
MSNDKLIRSVLTSQNSTAERFTGARPAPINPFLQDHSKDRESGSQHEKRKPSQSGRSEGPHKALTLEHVLFSKQDLRTEDLEQSCLNGKLRDSRFRSLVWRILLKVLPVERSDWRLVLTRTRKFYDDLKHKYDHADPRRESLQSLNPDVNNPLAQFRENPWQEYFADVELREVISKDVDRTFPDLPFFQSKTTRQLMLDILFVYSKLNPHISYRQGMHEILAPILFVIYFDQQAHTHHQELQNDKSEESPSDRYAETLDFINDTEYLEHDAFSLFRSVMMLIEGWYDTGPYKGFQLEKEPDEDDEDTACDEVFNNNAPSDRRRSIQGNPSKAIAINTANPSNRKTRQILGSTPFASFSPRSMMTHNSTSFEQQKTELQRKLEYIYNDLLYNVDGELYERLVRLEIAPQIYGIRWLRLLFGREFPLHDLLFLWDTIFSTDTTFVDYVFVALLVQIRHLLLGPDCDYTTCIQYLMRYPPTADIQSFIQLALHLRSPKKYPKPLNMVMVDHRNATSNAAQHPAHNQNHIFPHITQTGQTHPNFDRQSSDIPHTNHNRHSHHADFTGGVIGHQGVERRPSGIGKTSIETAIPMQPNSLDRAVPQAKEMELIEASRFTSTSTLTHHPDVELMKEQIALLQARLNDVDIASQLAAKAIGECCHKLQDVILDKTSDDVAEDSIEASITSSMKVENEKLHLEQVVLQLRGAISVLMGGVGMSRQVVLSGNVPSNEIPKTELCRIESAVEIAKEANGEISSLESASLESPPMSRSRTNTNTAGSEFRSRVSSQAQPNTSDLIESRFERKKNF